MSAFHGSRELRELRVQGMDHMRRSLSDLANSIGDMHIDTALATTLVLAFSESWDTHISTGIQHLRGAKALMNNALVKYNNDPNNGNSSNKNTIKFLCNTFMYMDVIARLTSVDSSDSSDLDNIAMSMNTENIGYGEVDPLMGCATTLFPLIGRVADLIARVRKSETNSLTLVCEAAELRQSILEWQLPPAAIFERPEDDTSQIQHSIQTAEAYRWATLLYLSQAVPEVPSEAPEKLAARVLTLLATVPLSSRVLIVQIFPLLAASCEATTAEDRAWVSSRWQAMMNRLCIGNVDLCWQVVEEAWRRRDEFEGQKVDALVRKLDARGIPQGGFVPPPPPPHKTHKRKHSSSVNFGDGGVFDAFGPSLDMFNNHHKRKLLADQNGIPQLTRSSTDFNVAMIGQMPSQQKLNRSMTDSSQLRMEDAYTVRGRLHWLGVMRDWEWESMTFPYHPRVFVTDSYSLVLLG